MKVSPERVAVILDFLQRGGKVLLDGYTFVWLDEHVVRETEDSIWVIDGLAHEGVSLNTNTGETTPHYMGQKDMPIGYFFKLINEMPQAQYEVICMKLRGMRGNSK